LSSMIPANKPDWSRRIERAFDLAVRHPGTAEVLNFYRRVLEFQKDLYERATARSAPAPDGPFRERLDVGIAMQQLPALLSLVRGNGPSKLAQEATDLSKDSSERARQALKDFLKAPDADDDGRYAFFARVLLQPLAEHLAAIPAATLAGFSGMVCPVCDAKPQVAVLRPEGDGGKRFLVCSFCMTEWEFRRVLCPVCGQEDHTKLPRYTAEGISAVRVEACETCHFYLKSVDLTVDGHAVPVVDEVATASLDLWAMENGFQKIRRNLMGF
jgi:FdhE protein